MIPSRQPSPDEEYDRAVLIELLHNAIDQLPTRHRQILDRYLFNREPIATIAADLGISPNMVYKCIHRIRETLGEKILTSKS